MPMVLPPEESEAGPWAAVEIGRVAQFLLHQAAEGRPWVVAIDGRGAGGKSTLAASLLPWLEPATVVHTDDLAWHEPFFGWGRLLAREVLEPLRRGEPVSFQPPAWRERGRAGSVDVPADVRVVVVEGSGANQREFADLIDRTIWVQADHKIAEARGIARDVESGVNGGPEDARRFWHEWMAHELPFFAAERPWERSDLVVAGTPVLPLADGEVACAPRRGVSEGWVGVPQSGGGGGVGGGVAG